MAYNEDLAGRIRSVLSSRSGVEEKNLFGGLTFAINGNMCCSISDKTGLILRVGTEKYEEVLAMPNMQPRMLGEKKMNGMVVAEPAAYASDEDLAKIVNMAADVAASLPPKVK
ncbi:TfoX/Sxy family protein [Candidatus Dojkabacteria bacterium]|uniref:TfoX/Sxy family protein n=1 Tax=Candidatus Dojkabacteria bacterium TaxID=2099670 RepID=A0A955LBS9_9BACT|nr:TfoX/Sxy family protein [Candidatus Dojkabacteria bacterium]